MVMTPPKAAPLAVSIAADEADPDILALLADDWDAGEGMANPPPFESDPWPWNL